MHTGFTMRGGGRLEPAPFVIFGIVNATPDSFFDGKGHTDCRAALGRARRVWRQGAAVLDIGGESTRPYAPPVPPDEECRRVLPVVQAISCAVSQEGSRKTPQDGARRSGKPGNLTVRGAARGFAPRPDGSLPALSVDTRRANVAAAVLEAGAHIINDVSGCADPALPDVLAQYKPGYVLMHTQGEPETMQDRPEYDQIIDQLLDFFAERMNMLVRAGLPEDCIILDPGIGFGKRLEHNLAILKELPRFFSLGRPVLLGLSNKSLFGDLLGLPVNKRGGATQVATALAFQKGVAFHRVHDVAAAAQALTLARAAG